MTRTPVRFSRVVAVTLSSWPCTRRYIGIVISMMENTMMHSATITPAKISAQRVSMVKAMIIAPKTTNGERSSRRSAHVHARLHLIDVAVHAGDERGGADRVQLRVAQRLDMLP